MTRNEQRPNPTHIQNAQEFQRWYWRKDELTALAKHHGVKSTGAKFDILDRIAHFLNTGEKSSPKDIALKSRRAPQKSSFDWHCEILDENTIITNSYKNTQNVRRFFKQHCGEGFKFNIAFMEWMKANIGKTLQDAVDEHNHREQLIKTSGNKTKIKPHNQYNQYCRDFLADNPNLKMSHVRIAWAKKIELPSNTGRHIYEKSDLMFL
jgi:hypothetical protein